MGATGHTVGTSGWRPLSTIVIGRKHKAPAAVRGHVTWVEFSATSPRCVRRQSVAMQLEMMRSRAVPYKRRCGSTASSAGSRTPDPSCNGACPCQVRLKRASLSSCTATYATYGMISPHAHRAPGIPAAVRLTRRGSQAGMASFQAFKPALIIARRRALLLSAAVSAAGWLKSRRPCGLVEGDHFRPKARPGRLEDQCTILARHCHLLVHSGNVDQCCNHGSSPRWCGGGYAGTPIIASRGHQGRGRLAQVLCRSAAPAGPVSLSNYYPTREFRPTRQLQAEL